MRTCVPLPGVAAPGHGGHAYGTAVTQSSACRRASQVQDNITDRHRGFTLAGTSPSTRETGAQMIGGREAIRTHARQRLRAKAERAQDVRRKENEEDPGNTGGVHLCDAG